MSNKIGLKKNQAHENYREKSPVRRGYRHLALVRSSDEAKLENEFSGDRSSPPSLPPLTPKSSSLFGPIAYSFFGHVALLVLLFCYPAAKQETDLANFITLDLIAPTNDIVQAPQSTQAINTSEPQEQPKPLPVIKENKPKADTKPKQVVAKPEITTNLKKVAAEKATSDNQTSSTDQQSTPLGSSAAETQSSDDQNSQANRAAGASYDQIVMSQLIAAKRYPERAKKRGVEGEIILAFRVNRDGSVSDSQLIKVSTSEILNQEGLEMLARAAPFPAPPASYRPGKSLEYKVPVQFKLF